MLAFVRLMLAVFEDLFAHAFGGLARSAKYAPAVKSARAANEPMIERLVGIIAERVLHARDEQELVANVDALLETGVIASYVRPLLAAMQRDGLLSTDHASRPLLATASLCPAARSVIDEASADHAWLVLVWQSVSSELGSGPLFDDVLLEASRRPLWFLSELPVEIAEAMLRAERGLPAMVALQVAAESPEIVGADESRQVALAQMFRDAVRATLRLSASVKPALIPLDVVPASERFDVAQIAERRRAEDEQLRALALEAEAKGGPVRVSGHGR